MERRPSAGKDEVLAALLRGQFTGLLLKKRIPLGAAEEALTAAEGFLGLSAGAASSDERLRPLADYCVRERARDKRANKAPRRVGESAIYTVQRHKNKRRAFVVVPLGTLDDEDGSLREVRITFNAGDVVITKVHP